MATNKGTTKIKAISRRALEIREKAGFTTETIVKKRYRMAYVPDAIKQAAKELKTPVVPVKKSRTIVKSKLPARLPRTKLDEFPYEIGYRAYYWNSFSPDKRGLEVQRGYANTLNEYAKEIEKHIKTKDQLSTARAEFIRFKAGYTAKYKAWLSALSRTASSAVTGAAKFPVEKNRKALNAEHARSVELSEYEKNVKKIIEKVKGAATPEMKDDAAWQSIKKEITDRTLTIIAIKMGKHPGSDVRLFVSNFTGLLQRGAKNMRVDQYNRAIDLIEELEAKYNVKVFAANNPIRIRLVEKEKTPAETETVELYNKNGLRVENNKGDERVRLFFNGKPSATIIAELKKHAWKWSPSNMAWQRKNTADAFYYLRKFFIPEFIENK